MRFIVAIVAGSLFAGSVAFAEDAAPEDSCTDIYREFIRTRNEYERCLGGRDPLECFYLGYEVASLKISLVDCLTNQMVTWLSDYVHGH